jgi:hypothetical protein
MLKRLQHEYAEKPVRFLLFPCNQFGAQEPGSNAEVKQFAEKFVKLGPGSNVVMFAKSDLNNVPCSTSGKDACTPSSKECCPTNDPVYEYLLSATSPGTIQWNFDKIVVDGSGKPFPGETIYHGGDVDKALGAAISTASTAPKVLAATQTSGARQPYYVAGPLLLAAMGFVFGVKVTTRAREEQPVPERHYIQLM